MSTFGWIYDYLRLDLCLLEDLCILEGGPRALRALGRAPVFESSGKNHLDLFEQFSACLWELRLFYPTFILALI